MITIELYGGPGCGRRMRVGPGTREVRLAVRRPRPAVQAWDANDEIPMLPELTVTTVTYRRADRVRVDSEYRLLHRFDYVPERKR